MTREEPPKDTEQFDGEPCPEHEWMGRVAGTHRPCPYCEDTEQEHSAEPDGREAISADESVIRWHPVDPRWRRVIDALKILQDRTIGSLEANARAIDVLVIALSTREGTERPDGERIERVHASAIQADDVIMLTDLLRRVHGVKSEQGGAVKFDMGDRWQPFEGEEGVWRLVRDTEQEPER